jgi:hypothetical protein
MVTTGMRAHALARGNLVQRKVLRNLIYWSLDAEHNVNSLVLKDLDGLHSHAAGKNMSYATGSQEPGEFSWLVSRTNDTFVVDDLIVPDVIYLESFTVAEV